MSIQLCVTIGWVNYPCSSHQRNIWENGTPPHARIFSFFVNQDLPVTFRIRLVGLTVLSDWESSICHLSTDSKHPSSHPHVTLPTLSSSESTCNLPEVNVCLEHLVQDVDRCHRYSRTSQLTDSWSHKFWNFFPLNSNRNSLAWSRLIWWTLISLISCWLVRG